MPAKPSLELLRSLTDERVLRAVMEDGPRTRAELASRTGLSKPTASESVRRLTEAGLLRDTGERTSGRGRAGSYYSLSDASGHALVASITPRGVVAEVVDAFGEVVRVGEEALEWGATPVAVSAALACVADHVRSDLPGPMRCAVVSAADPVDRATGRLVHLPDLPFLVGDLDPVADLTPFVEGPVLVDNDVNWAARAQLGTEALAGLADVLVVHLGEGLGCAVVTDGEVRRGGHGLAGEIAHVLTRGPDGRAMPLIEVFADLGLRREGSTAIDVDLLLRRIGAGDDGAVRLLEALAVAVAGVLSAAVGLVDPGAVVLGGPWGADPKVVTAVAKECARSPREVVVRAAVDDPERSGVRRRAVEELRRLIVASSLGPR
ncbi:MAG: ROK family protein [Janibacter sp.]